MIRSSWNTDKIASCTLNKTHKVRQPIKHRYLVQYKDKEVCICNSKGKVRFSYAFRSPVASALIKDEVLKVITEDGSRFTYDVHSGKLIGAVLSQADFKEHQNHAALSGAA